MEQGAWGRLPALAQFAGMVSGLLIWLLPQPEVGSLGSWLLLFCWSAGLGLAFWGAAACLLRLGGRPAYHQFRSLGRAHLAVLLSPTAWIGFGCLLLLTLGSHFMAIRASDQVVAWYQANMQIGQTGYLGQLTKRPGWQYKPDYSWINSRVDLNPKDYPLSRGDHYFTRHAAALKLEHDREVEFRLSSDDGSLLLVDGLRIIDHRGLHPAFFKSAVLRLKNGWHSIEVLHFEESGDSSVRLELPPQLNALAHPLGPDFDRRALWSLDVNAQNWANRTLFMAVITLFCLSLTLLPHPFNWHARVAGWVLENRKLLILCAALGLLNCVGLNDWPGIDGDSAHHGLIGVDWYWRAHITPTWVGYANQNLFSWPEYGLLHFFPLSLGMLRWYTTIGNLVGLLLLGLAAQSGFGRRTALAVMAVLGLSGLFFFSNRHFIDPYTYAFLGLGLAFFGLARARDHIWGGALCACGLSLLWQVHGLYVPFVAGFVLFVFIVAGLKPLRNIGFWLGLATLLAWNYSWIMQYLTKGFDHPSYVFQLEKWWELARGLVFPQAYQMLSGSRLALYFAGREAWYIPPVTPLILLGALAIWPFVKLPALGRRVGLGLLCIVPVCVILTARTITLQEIRYAFPLVVTLLLWLGLFLGLAMEHLRRFRWVSGAAICLLTVSGLYAYAAWLVPQALYGGTCSNVPGAVFDSDRTINKRELYQALAGLNTPVHFNHWDRFSMLFHEAEDITGHFGVYFSPRREPGGLLVGYNCTHNAAPPLGAAPASLGPYLDRKFKAWRLPAPRKEARK